MPEPGETGSVEEMFRCWRCGDEFPTNGENEMDCPVCGTHCDREKCQVIQASDVGF